MAGHAQGFRFHLWQLFALITLAAFASLAIVTVSEVTAQLLSTIECMLVIAAMTFIPCSSGPRLRFLIAFVGSAALYELFNRVLFYGPFDTGVERLSHLVSSIKGIDLGETHGPRSDFLTNFRSTVHALIALAIALMSGWIASSIRPSNS